MTIRGHALKLVVGLGFLGSALGLAPASPAAAHASFVRTPPPYQEFGIARVSHNHLEFEVCDGKADGWGVRGYFLMETETLHKVGDANGSKPGCGHGNGFGYKVVYYYVCTGPNGENRSCSKGVNT